jgi:hypothetical protein
MFRVTDVLESPAADRFCDSCGYNLRGLTNDRCPECGREFDPNAPPIAQIPWLRRSQIGAWRAYWQTVFAVTFHPVQFARETGKPVWLKLADAERFRKLISRQAAASATISAVLILSPEFLRRSSLETWLLWLVFVGAVWAFSAVFFRIGTTALPITFAAPIDLARVRLLQYYAMAPWAMMPLVALVGTIAVCFAGGIFWKHAVALFFFVLALQVGLVWIAGIATLGSISEYHFLALVEAAVMIPLAWFAAFVASVVAMLGIAVLGFFLLSVITTIAEMLSH